MDRIGGNVFPSLAQSRRHRTALLVPPMTSYLNHAQLMLLSFMLTKANYACNALWLFAGGNERHQNIKVNPPNNSTGVQLHDASFPA